MQFVSPNPREPRQYAGESYQHAVQLMNSADAYATEGHSDRKQLIAKSRETVQTAEDAREIAVKKIDEDRAGERTPGFGRCTGAVAGAGR